MDRADLLVLRAIQDQFGKRPIAFARTAWLYPDRFGFGANLVGQGMVRVLTASPGALGAALQHSPELGYVNLPLSRELLEKVYHADTAARPRPLGWIDTPSANIPGLYAYLYQTTGLMLVKSAPLEAIRLLTLADSMAGNTDPQRRRS